MRYKLIATFENDKGGIAVLVKSFWFRRSAVKMRAALAWWRTAGQATSIMCDAKIIGPDGGYL
jgi:hypothetical protein